MKSCIESMDNVELNGNIRSNKHPGCASQCLQQSSFFNISISDVFCIDFRKKERKKEDSFEAESQWRFPRGLGQRQFARLDNVVANGFESLTNSIEWRHHKLEPNFFNSVLFFLMDLSSTPLERNDWNSWEIPRAALAAMRHSLDSIRANRRDKCPNSIGSLTQNIKHDFFNKVLFLENRHPFIHFLHLEKLERKKPFAWKFPRRWRSRMAPPNWNLAKLFEFTG